MELGFLESSAQRSSRMVGQPLYVTRRLRQPDGLKGPNVPGRPPGHRPPAAAMEDADLDRGPRFPVYNVHKCERCTPKTKCTTGDPSEGGSLESLLFVEPRSRPYRSEAWNPQKTATMSSRHPGGGSSGTSRTSKSPGASPVRWGSGPSVSSGTRAPPHGGRPLPSHGLPAPQGHGAVRAPHLPLAPRQVRSGLGRNSRSVRRRCHRVSSRADEAETSA